jgi:FMN phosphatase YigB (HAD superfamily)
MPGHRAVDTVVFDLGGVLIDWDPRYLYRKLFAGDEPGMERFLAEVTTSAWNLSLDAGKPFGEALAELIATHPHERARIEAYHARWIEMISGPIPGTVALLEGLAARACRSTRSRTGRSRPSRSSAATRPTPSSTCSARSSSRASSR